MRRSSSALPRRSLLLLALVAALASHRDVAAQRSLGLDVSAWQGNISSSSWSQILNTDGRDFVFVRSSRGGTTGYYNQSDPGNTQGNNTLSQRYDDPYFVQNITRATAAGLYAGSYHFARPDIVASTANSGGVANSGADEADHYLEMAGAWMRPGYLLPVLDLEAGQSERTANELAQFGIDFSDRIYEQTGVRPAVYIGGNYANYVQGASSSVQDELVAALPALWSARWPNQSNPDAIPVQTGHPKDSYSPVYGPWDDSPNPTHPWAFWQYTSTGRLSGYNNGNSNLDLNVAQGGVEFLKDNLVPALWTGGATGDWSTLENWNSGQQPVAPAQGPGQVPRVGRLFLPSVRLPGPDDTVVLDVDDEAVAVTLSSGDHSVRRLIARESLSVAGGSLAIGVVPSSDSPEASLVVGASVSVAGGEVSAHTVRVEPQQTLTLDGGLAFESLQVSSGPRTGARVLIDGDVAFAAFDADGAVIESVGGFNAEGYLDLGGGNHRLSVEDGAAAVDLRLTLPVLNGGFAKAGAGVMLLEAATGYQGDVDVQEGQLVLDSLLLDDAADVSVNGAAVLTLDRAGPADVIGRLTLDGAPMGLGVYGAIGSGAQFESALISGAGTLQVTAVSLAGDYNADGVVDAADYTVWRDALGQAASLPNETATPGQVTQADYDAWLANFGATLAPSGAGAAPAPEPAALGLLCLVCSWFPLRRVR